MARIRIFGMLIFTVLLLSMFIIVPMTHIFAATPTPTLATDGNVASVSNQLRGILVTINDDDPMSGAASLNGLGLVQIIMPTTWVTANLTFQSSGDCSTYQNLYDKNGTEYTVTAAASRNIITSPSDFAGMQCLKFRSGTSGTPVTQTTTVNIRLMLRVF